MDIRSALFASLLLATPAIAAAQDAAAWIASQGLEPRDVKAFGDLEIAVARSKEGEDRAVVLKQGKPLWQSGPKDAEPGAKWTIQSVGRDLNGDGQPDAHFVTTTSGPNNCCTTHHIVQLKPQVKRIATQPMGGVGGSDFIELPGRKAPVMISADDSSANAFAPYATSYFPMVVLEVGKGRFQLAKDLMQSKLPGQPPAICATPAPTANAWLRERCAEFSTVRRQDRVTQIKQRLAEVKATRSADVARWEDYVSKNAVGPVAAELNRYAYTGHGAAGYNWLETIWPGNDTIKARLIASLQQTHAKSAFAEDLKALASGR